jgi:hypothetical protein
MSKRQIARVLPAAVLVAVLAGCAPAVTQTTSPVAAGSSTPTVAPSVTPTPTQAPLANPVVQVSLGCEELLSLSAVDEAASDTAVVLRSDQTTRPASLDDVALRQRGTLQCVWGGKTQTDGGYDNGLTVDVAVDAAAAYATNVPLYEKTAPATATNTAGDQSEYGCGDGGNSSEYACDGNVLVGTFWATASLQHAYGKTSATLTQADSGMQKMLSGIASSLEHAQTLPAWAAPAATTFDFCANAATNTAKVRSIFGVPTMTIKPAPDDATYDATTATTSANTYISCTWGHREDGLSAYELPNGAWALPGMVASPPILEGIGTYKAVTVPGADITLFVHGGEGASSVIFSVGANAYDLAYSDYGTAKDTAIMTALIAQIG